MSKLNQRENGGPRALMRPHRQVPHCRLWCINRHGAVPLSQWHLSCAKCELPQCGTGGPGASLSDTHWQPGPVPASPRAGACRLSLNEGDRGLGSPGAAATPAATQAAGQRGALQRGHSQPAGCYPQWGCWGYSKGTPGVLRGYSEGTLGVLRGPRPDPPVLAWDRPAAALRNEKNPIRNRP